MKQKIISVNEVENALETYTNIEEPIIVKRKDKEDVIILSIEEFKKRIFLTELDRKLEEAEDDIKNKRIHKARETFNELRDQYGY